MARRLSRRLGRACGTNRCGSVPNREEGRSLVRPRIAIVVSHPIQHFCPMYHSFSRTDAWDTRVFFASSAGLKKQWDPDFGRELRWEGLTMDFPHEFVNGDSALPVDNNLDAPRLASALDAYGPDVLIVYGYSQQLQKRAIAWGRKRAVPMLMISDSENRYGQSYIKTAVKHVVLRQLYRAFSGFLSVGDANEAYYQQFGVAPARLFRSPFPIDRDFFEGFVPTKQQHRTETRGALGISDAALVCGIVGKFVPWKRQIDLIRALRHLEHYEREIVSILIGSGPDEAELKKEAATLQRHKVVFAGFVQPTELPKLYAALDVYVHTSAHEPHSLAISEAIYMGCPVVLSDKCGSYGPTDDVQPGRNGLVYPCGDVPALARALQTLGSDAPRLATYSEKSRVGAVAAQARAHGEGLAAALSALGIGSVDAETSRAPACH
jgi:glycosyltransferase involved in cell wall biosynthesis